MSDGLWLYTDSLFSKWGFGDGDLPDEAWDWMDGQGISYGDLDWHPVLVTLVRRYLLPALSRNVEVYEVATIHNPIRAAKVEGVEVPDVVIYGDAPNIYGDIMPAGVCVPWPVVHSLIVREVSP